MGAFSSGQVVQYDGSQLTGGPAFTGTYAAGDAPVYNGTAFAPFQRSLRRVTGSNQNSSSTTYADITNLNVTINRTGFITFQYWILYSTSGVGEGIGLQLAFTGTAAGIGYSIDMFTDAATRAPLVTALTFGSGLAPQAVGPGAVDVIARIEGSCNVTAVGVLSCQFRAETGGANSVTARVASWAHVSGL